MGPPTEQLRDRDWRDFVLLLVDVQLDFWTDVAQRFPKFPENVDKLLEFCRAEGLDIVHLRAEFQPDRSDWMARYMLGRSVPCIRGTPGAEVISCGAARPDEKVIVKQTFDGFRNPELLQYLQDSRKRFVLVAGLVTSVCVLLTAASAAQTGFLTAVVADCCADISDMHRHILEEYPFIFETTAVARLADSHHDWQAALSKLEAQR